MRRMLTVVIVALALVAPIRDITRYYYGVVLGTQVEGPRDHEIRQLKRGPVPPTACPSSGC